MGREEREKKLVTIMMTTKTTFIPGLLCVRHHSNAFHGLQCLFASPCHFSDTPDTFLSEAFAQLLPLPGIFSPRHPRGSIPSFKCLNITFPMKSSLTTQFKVEKLPSTPHASSLFHFSSHHLSPSKIAFSCLCVLFIVCLPSRMSAPVGQGFISVLFTAVSPPGPRTVSRHCRYSANIS